MRAVVDTNVVLVANDAHEDVSPDCVIACIDRLQELMKRGTVVIDDAYRILAEYQHKTTPMKNKRAGDVFVLWLLKNSANSRHVEQVALQEPVPDTFDEFPDAELQAVIDPPDRKFLATAAAHRARPPVWQATDCKWLDWWPRLQATGVTVDFLCEADLCRFYTRKFPDRPLPARPVPK
jgi:hypothetical protein